MAVCLGSIVCGAYYDYSQLYAFTHLTKTQLPKSHKRCQVSAVTEPDDETAELRDRLEQTSEENARLKEELELAKKRKRSAVEEEESSNQPVEAVKQALIDKPSKEEPEEKEKGVEAEATATTEEKPDAPEETSDKDLSAPDEVLISFMNSHKVTCPGSHNLFPHLTFAGGSARKGC